MIKADLKLMSGNWGMDPEDSEEDIFRM